MEREIKTHTVLGSAKQGGGKSSLQKELEAAAKKAYQKIWQLNFADPIYELHNFIQNRIQSYHKEYGEEKLRTQCPQDLHNFCINKMAGWGYTNITSDPHLLDYLKKYVAMKLEKGLVDVTTKDGTLLQYLGTEFGRAKYRDDVWIDYYLRRVEKLPGIKSEDTLIIIGDCRFENEFDAVPEALRIRLECPEAIRKIRTDSWRENTQHPSEIGLDRYAELGLFDMYCNTSPMGITPEGIASLVMAKLDKGEWTRKRWKVPIPMKETTK